MGTCAAPAELHERGGQSAPLSGVPIVRLRSGVKLAFIGDEADGWVVESTARLLPGTVVEVILGSGFQEGARRALVARSEVIAIDRCHGVRYRTRLEVAGPSSERRGTQTAPGERTTHP